MIDFAENDGRTRRQVGGQAFRTSALAALHSSATLRNAYGGTPILNAR
ncbi:MAG: hypothetical protein IJP62_06605 [Treponema sp.]|nr:hypothetical protein [Treponema sp.]